MPGPRILDEQEQQQSDFSRVELKPAAQAM
jgi:hypothetical protein